MGRYGRERERCRCVLVATIFLVNISLIERENPDYVFFCCIFFQVHDTMEVKLKRSTSGQPWGFTIEGGRGSEFYHQDSSIVITGVANHTPALGILRYCYHSNSGIKNPLLINSV